MSVEARLVLIMLRQIVNLYQPFANGILLARIIIVILSQLKKLVRIFLQLKNVLGRILVFHLPNVQISYLPRQDVHRNKGIAKTTTMEPHVKMFLPTLVLGLKV